MTLHWRDRAACKPYPTDLWFPIGHGGCHGNGDLYDQARTICRRCPVRAECLDAALEWEHGVKRDNRSGMFGGLTPTERCTVDRERRLRGAA